jgi:NADH dehydrogenase
MTATGEREQRPAGAGAARVVVVGAGFGGLAAVRRLARSGMQTTLVDRNVYSTFQPLLYEVATAGLTSSDVAYPVRSESRRYHAAFRHGELAGIDPTARQIILADDSKIGYDYLVLATGVGAAYHGIPGAAEFSLGLYTRHDAIVLRDRIMVGLERMSSTGMADDVFITVIGGGATGVELAGSLADLRNIAVAADHPARRPQPDLRADQHVLAVPHLAAWRRPHCWRWPVYRIGLAEGYCWAPMMRTIGVCPVGVNRLPWPSQRR